MLSPAPIPLLCALLLSLPLAVIYTTITAPYQPYLTTTTTTTPIILYPSLPTPTTPTLPLKKTTTTDLNPLPLPNTPPIFKTNEKTIHKKGPTLSLPPPNRPLPVQPQFLGSSGEDDDGDDDKELFRLAIRVNPNPKRVKKVAFLFLTTSPLPFAPLWEMFFNHTIKNNNLFNIYIHADPTFNYSTPFTGVFTGRVIPSKPTRRHSPTLIAAARRLIAHALLHDSSNYMFSLLSPSCIPLHSFNYTYKTLTRSRRSFIEILKDEPGAYDRWAARGEQAMLPVVKFEDFRIGSQFFVLKRKHARIVVRDRRLWSKFKLPCLTIDTCYPEEHYFPTLLRMVDPRGCTPATLTHVDWSRSRGGHPRLYRKEEVSRELILALRRRRPRYGEAESNGSDWSVGKRHDPLLFARKFSPDSIEPLKAMANDVIFKDRS